MKESKQWNPSRWTEKGIRRRVRRVFKCAARDLAYLIGPHAGNLIMAELIGNMKSEQSKAELHRRGFKVIVDL